MTPRSWKVSHPSARTPARGGRRPRKTFGAPRFGFAGSCQALGDEGYDDDCDVMMMMMMMMMMMDDAAVVDEGDCDDGDDHDSG